MRAIYTLCPDPDSAQRVVDTLRVASLDLGFDAKRIVVVSGEPYEGYEFADEHASSRMFPAAALGGLTGGVLGYLLTSLTQKSYPLPTGSMPIVPPWTNSIIIYELTMLGAILTTLVYLFVSARLPNRKVHLTDPEIWTGKILVGVTDPPEASTLELEKRLSEAGVLEIKKLPASR
jgi:Alternative complex III, ActD subunit